MMRSVEQTLGVAVLATDGPIGDVYDIYFDDHEWTVRYYAVDTGRFFPGRKVLLAPHVLREPNRDEVGLPVALTRDQVHGSPEIDTARPIGRQAEAALYNYYGWAPYWIPLAPAAPLGVGGTTAERERSAEAGHYGGDPHLRSAKQVRNYRVHAQDGDIGHIEDFLFDDKTAKIRYAVVDTTNWAPGGAVLISPEWIMEVRWSESQVIVRVTREAVRTSPEYHRAMVLEPDYESRLFAHYGYPLPLL